MLEIIIALRIIGTMLLAIKLIGFDRNKIIKKCVGKSLIINDEKNVYIIKSHYLDMLKENIYATIGIIYVILAEILNLFLNDILINISQLKTITYTIIAGSGLLLISYLVVKLCLSYINKKENKMINVDNNLIEDGAIAVQLLEEDEKE